MEAYNRFNKTVFIWQRGLMKAFGHDIFVENFRLNFISYFWYTLLVECIVSEIYTMIYYEPLKKIFSTIFALTSLQVLIILCTLVIIKKTNSLAFQILVKLYHVQYFRELQKIVFFIRKIFEIHITTKSPERIEFLGNFARIIEYLFIGMCFLYMNTIFVFYPYPAYMYFLKNEVVPLLDLYVPGIDETTYLGYWILFVYHNFIVFGAMLGLLAADFILVMAMISSLIFAKLIWFEVQQLHFELKESEPMATVINRFVNILRMHQEFCE